MNNNFCLLSAMKVRYFHNNYWLSKLEFKIYLVLLVVIIVAQCIHYVTYFDQPLFRSFIWSLVDWSMWFLIIFLIIQNKSLQDYASNQLNKALILLICALLLPIIHTVLIKLVYLIIYEPSISFIDDLFSHFIKKWFQNSIVVTALILGFEYVRSIILPFNNKTKSIDQTWLILKDRKKTIRLRPADIEWVTKAKNYVVIKTCYEEFVIRSSLKSVYNLLEPHGFIMISRSAIMNIKFIRAIEQISKYRNILVMESGMKFSVSRLYLKETRKAVEIDGHLKIGYNYPKS